MVVNGGEPYVHSNIENFSAGNYDVSPTLIEGKQIEDSIAKLKAVSQQLKDEALDFLGGDSEGFLNYCVDNEYKMYAQIAVQLLQDPDAIAALMMGNTSRRMNSNDVAKLLKNVVGVLKDRIEEFVDIKKITEIGARALAIQIAAALSDGEGTLTVQGLELNNFVKQIIISNADEKVTEQMMKTMTGNIKPGSLSSGKKSGRLVDLIENVIVNRKLYNKEEKQQEEQFKDGIEAFMHWFKKSFLIKAKEVVHFYEVQQSPEEYLKSFEQQLRNKFKKGTVAGNAMNIVGALGDEFYVSAYQADAMSMVVKITMETIGTVKEKDVKKRYGNIFNGIDTMQTHHDTGKQSQTDILIRNKSGKTVRVQAKNASLANQEFENKGLIKLNAHLEREKKLATLLTALGVPGAEQIMYTVINSLWFGTHDSVTGERVKGKLSIKDGGGNANILSSLMQELSILFSTKAENFIGITLETAAGAESQILSGASNIFYLKNGRLIPTYWLVEEVIKDLQDYANNELGKLHGLHFSIKGASKTSWVYNDAVDFWIEKARNNFSKSVGLAQGTAAVSSLIVTGEFPTVTSLVVDVN